MTNVVRMCGGEINVDELRAAVDAKDWRSVLDQCSGLTSHIVVGGIWSCAMTCLYGPLGIHESRKDENGAPSAETLAKFPHVGEAMADAAERIRTHYLWRFDNWKRDG